MMSENARMVYQTIQSCEWKWREPWFFTDIFILITGVLTNVPLLWLLLREKKSSSASQVGAVLPSSSQVLKCHSTDGMPSLVKVK